MLKTIIDNIEYAKSGFLVNVDYNDDNRHFEKSLIGLLIKIFVICLSLKTT